MRAVRLAVLATALLGSVACAPVRQHATVADVGEVRVAGAGDVVMRQELRESLPNAFGRADLFGRTRDRGMIEVRYVGADPDGVLRFWRRDTSVMTNETTMSRARFGSTTGRVTATSYGASYNAVTVMSPDSRQQVLPPDVIPLSLDLRQGRLLPVNGAQIEVLDATAAGIRYRVIGQ
jgi:hypothetical protein